MDILPLLVFLIYFSSIGTRPIVAILYPSVGHASTPLGVPLFQAINAPLSTNDLSDFNDPFNGFNKVTTTTFTFPGSVSNSFYYSNQLPSVALKNTNDLLGSGLSSYYQNGRVLKQYLVTEDTYEDVNELDNYLSRFAPFVPSTLNSKFFSFPRASPPQPIQLGSGSLGYIRLANGDISLGSGSLGFIDDRDKANQLYAIRNRQSAKAGPLSFG